MKSKKHSLLWQFTLFVHQLWNLLIFTSLVQMMWILVQNRLLFIIQVSKDEYHNITHNLLHCSSMRQLSPLVNLQSNQIYKTYECVYKYCRFTPLLKNTLEVGRASDSLCPFTNAAGVRSPYQSATRSRPLSIGWGCDMGCNRVTYFFAPREDLFLLTKSSHLNRLEQLLFHSLEQLLFIMILNVIDDHLLHCTPK